VNSEHTKVRSFSHSNTSENVQTSHGGKKPIEIYLYIDPLCPKSWEIQPYLRKLTVQFGQYFTIRPIITKHFFTLNKVFVKHVETIHQLHELQHEHIQSNHETENILSPWTIALAIKAAELQGKNAGRLFLRKIQEAVFLNKNFIVNSEHFLECAELARLDIAEFKKDIHSTTAKKALRCDLKLANEMHVEQTPTIVLFNSLTDEEGIKLSGIHSYDIYTHILLKTLKMDVEPKNTPALIEYIQANEIITTKEISIVYDWSTKKATNELKKLQLQQIIEQEKTQSEDSFWSLIKQT